MLIGLMTLSYFDIISVVLSLTIIAISQWFHDKEEAIVGTAAKSLTASTDNANEIKSENSADSTPNSSARNSLNFSNGNIFHQQSIDSLSDEYHEDEDTLSLENLFPCDQTEIYASKKICFIIDELIQTELNYVNNMRKGLTNYGTIHDRQDVPEALKGSEKRAQLLGNIEEILFLHEQQILPLMLQKQMDLKSLFDELATHIDDNHFYCYVKFTMHKKTSLQLRQEQREWFQYYQTEINDKLGIDSFLVQPIQRLTRYPLLLQQFISEFYKSGIKCKPLLMSVCKLETRMRRMLEVVNQAEEIAAIEDLNERNLNLKDSYFRRCSEFDAFHYRSRKKYRLRVYLFEHYLVCVEVRKKRLVYRHHYIWDSLELQLINSKSIKLLVGGPTPVTAARVEYDFTASEASVVKEWMRCARKIIDSRRMEAMTRGKFSLPMDLVLGMLLVVWLIWHYLY